MSSKSFVHFYKKYALAHYLFRSLKYLINRTRNKHEGGLISLKRSYTSHDIEKAVELAEARGLDDFMMQHPKEKQHATHKRTGRNDHRDFSGDAKRKETQKKSIFDEIMFGSPSPKTDYPDSHTDQLTTSSMSESEYPKLEDDLITCDPCEEVQEIVRGIRAGKYKLRTTAFQENTVTESTPQHITNRLRLPEHWRNVTKHRRNTRMNKLQEDDFQYHSAYSDAGNMWALRLSKKNYRN